MTHRTYWPCLFAASMSLLSVAGRAETITELKAREARVRAVVDRAMPCVVAIVARNMQKNPGSGSGVIVSKDGLILTAAHVTAATGKELTIVFPDGRRVNGEALGANKTTDAGMAKITEPGEWEFAEIGSSDKVRLGDWCIAMGHPGGFSFERRPPVRLGRIWKRELDGAIYSSCPLIGGDSGGPLFDLETRVIGINSSIHGSVESNRHVAVDTLRADWDRMLKGETWGRQSYASNNRRRPRTGATFDRESQDGVRIELVDPDTPAAKAGLQPGDIVTRFDGHAVDTFHALQRLLTLKKAGDKVKISVRRGPETIDTELELARQPSREDFENNNDGGDGGGDPPKEPKLPETSGPQPWFGAELEDTDGKGAKLSRVHENSPAAKAGLTQGDLLLRVNDKDVDGPTAAAELIRRLKPGDKLTLKARRGDMELSADATLEQRK